MALSPETTAESMAALRRAFGMDKTAWRMKYDRELGGKVYAKAGDIVYPVRGPDYGLAGDDTRYTGVEHVSVTLNENGDYPCFTVPVTALEKL